MKSTSARQRRRHVQPRAFARTIALVTALLVYRDRHDEIGFMEINPVTAHLIQKIQLHPGMTGTEILEQIAGELNHPNPDVVINGGKEILEQLRAADILLGAKK